jgi:hypothetical protein
MNTLFFYFALFLELVEYARSSRDFYAKCHAVLGLLEIDCWGRLKTCRARTEAGFDFRTSPPFVQDLDDLDQAPILDSTSARVN